MEKLLTTKQKSDEGNLAVLINKDLYTERVKNIIQDLTKFKPIMVNRGKELNFIINQELCLKKVYNTLLKKGSISEETYKKLCPVGSRPGILYGLCLCKVHNTAHFISHWDTQL